MTTCCTVFHWCHFTTTCHLPRPKRTKDCVVWKAYLYFSAGTGISCEIEHKYLSLVLRFNPWNKFSVEQISDPCKWMKCHSLLQLTPIGIVAVCSWWFGRKADEMKVLCLCTKLVYYFNVDSLKYISQMKWNWYLPIWI